MKLSPIFRELSLLAAALLVVLVVTNLLLHKSKTETPKTTSSIVVTNSHLEINEESDYIRGYKEGIKTGHEGGFRSGAICAYVVISSGVQCTNIMELILKSQEYASNSIAIWKKANP